jgi:hypothetical protein
MSLGPRPPEELLPWVEWVQRPAEDPAPAPASVSPEPPAVRDWCDELPRLLAVPDQALHQCRLRQQEFLEWTATDPGSTVFDRMVRGQVQGRVRVQTRGTGTGTGEPAGKPASDSRTLCDVLVRARWCEIWPSTDPDTGQGLWPSGRSISCAPKVTWAEHPSVPLGHADPSAFRYGPTLELVEGTFSLGSPAPGSALAEALRLDRSVRAGRWVEVEKAMSVAATTLRQAQIDAELNGSPLPVTELAGPVLDGLMAVAHARPETAVLDDILEAMRGWASAQGLTIQPRSWSFASPPPVDRLESEPEGLGAPVAGFTPDAPVGTYRLVDLGWSGPEGIPPRPVRFTLSAGPAPVHYEELRARLAAATDWPEARGLLSELDEWPRRRIDSEDSLRFAAEHFFDSFWKAAGPPPLNGDREPIAGLLGRMLLQGFGLETFFPTSTREYDRDCIKVLERGTWNTGRVSRVVRPGLRSAVDGVSYQALVDVE